MSTKDLLTKIYSEAAWSIEYREGIRKLKAVNTDTKEDRELKWCYLGFMYDHLASPFKPTSRKEMETAARYAYRQALRLNPDCTTAMIGLGRILVNRDDIRALNWYRRAFQVDPKGPKVEFSLAYACFILGQFNEAGILFKKLHRRDPSCFGYVYNLALLEAKQGNQKQSKHFAEFALKLFTFLPHNERESKGGKGFKKTMIDLIKHA